MKIKAVTLDFGGTLATGNLEWDSYHEALLQYIVSLGYIVKMVELKRALRAALRELNKVRNKGLELTFEEVYSHFLELLNVRHNADNLEDIHQIFRSHYKSVYFSCTENVLNTLSNDYKLALISNTMSNNPHIMLEKYQYSKYFDLIICSSDIGLRKPNPKIFNYVLEKIDVKPSEAVHVGDNVAADMVGATNSGITGIWIKNPQDEWSGYAIKNICELPHFLKKLEET